jgi:hypothetical protein
MEVVVEGIRISPKHGLNPSMSVCFLCGGDKNEIIIPGMLKGDAEAPHKAVWNKEPCDKCKEYMNIGVMLISVKDKTDQENPYRTGNIVVIKADAAERMFGDSIKNQRAAFIEDELWDKLGLPKEIEEIKKI